MSRTKNKKHPGSIEFQGKRDGFNAKYTGSSGKEYKTRTHRHERRAAKKTTEEASR